MTWQPIETAPKVQYEFILVYCSHGFYVASWLSEDESDSGIDGWFVDDNKHGPFPLRGGYPTHWMPLPPAPDTAVDNK